MSAENSGAEIASACAALQQARALTTPEARLLALRIAGEELAEALRRGPSVRVSTLRFDRLVLERAVALPVLRAPLSFLTLERCASRVETSEGVLLVDPATPDAFAATPFGQRFFERHPLKAKLMGTGASLVSAGMGEVRSVILTTLRYQSLEPLLDRFPRAQILVHPAELVRYLNPPSVERGAYERSPLAEHERLLVLNEGVITGGVCAVATPGLGGASMSVVMNHGGVLRVHSPHGIAQDCWSPYESRLPGLREAMRLRDTEAVGRGDADPLESSISMGLERVLADRRLDAPAFLEITPSVELVASALSPIWPSVRAH